MATYFHLETAPTLAAIPSSKSQVSITRLKSEGGLADRTSRIPPERAFLISIHLSPAEYRDYEVWIDGEYDLIPSWRAGAIGIYDLESDPVWRYSRGFDCVHYHLPRTALDAYSEANGWPRIDTLRCPQGKVDRVLHQMTQMILPTLQEEKAHCELFLDHFRFMVCAHVIRSFGSVPLREATFQGGLAPWQKRRVTALLHANLDGNFGLAQLAEECGLSVSHFSRSFKKSFGTSVHRYLILQRIEAAKQLMSTPTSSLTDVALLAGFSDQSSFNRTFRAIVGTTPGSWRREAFAIRPPVKYSSQYAAL